MSSSKRIRIGSLREDIQFVAGTSITFRAVTKFLDIRDLGKVAPNRVAVLVKKDETPHLTVLARNAQIVRADDPDEVFRRAA
jgi:hypothetical protein